MGEEREVLNVVVKCGPKGPRHRPQRADRLEAFLRPSRLRARRIVTPAVAPVQVPRPAHAQGLLDVVPPGRRVQAMLERDGVVQGEGDRGRAREVLHEERDDLLGGTISLARSTKTSLMVRVGKHGFSTAEVSSRRKIINSLSAADCWR